MFFKNILQKKEGFFSFVSKESKNTCAVNAA